MENKVAIEVANHAVQIERNHCALIAATYYKRYAYNIQDQAVANKICEDILAQNEGNA